VIPLTTDRQIGPTLRELRHNAGLSLRQLSQLASLSASGIQKRERSTAGYVGILIEHVRPLGYAVALIPQRHPGARPTGTGWPA
jgi:transcriptional regulator with XRE-family HTH domain